MINHKQTTSYFKRENTGVQAWQACRCDAACTPSGTCCDDFAWECPQGEDPPPVDFERPAPQVAAPRPAQPSAHVGFWLVCQSPGDCGTGDLGKVELRGI